MGGCRGEYTSDIGLAMLYQRAFHEQPEQMRRSISGKDLLAHASDREKDFLQNAEQFFKTKSGQQDTMTHDKFYETYVHHRIPSHFNTKKDVALKNSILQALDPDNDGHISWEEWQTWVSWAFRQFEHEGDLKDIECVHEKALLKGIFTLMLK